MEVILLITAIILGGGLGYTLVHKGKKNVPDESALSKEPDANIPSDGVTSRDGDSKTFVSSPVQDILIDSGEKAVQKNIPLSLDDHQLIREAKNRAKEILLEAKDIALKTANKAEEDARKVRDSVSVLEKEAAVKEAKVEGQKEELKEKTESLRTTQEAIEKKKEAVDGLYEEQKRKLQEVSALTREEAREILLQRFDQELREEKSKRIRQLEEDIGKTAEEKSQEILMDALTHGARDYVIEHTTSRVKLPDPEIKGRIIGKEGRNITTFEKLAGVELDLDSSQGEIIVSCFDPVRREIGKIALERLIADGRIQPGRIEDIVAETQKDIDHIIYKEGDKLCHMLGVYSLPKEIIQILGKFKYRFSYGQNMTKHTLEVAGIGIAIAGELGADVETVRMGCLLHDIGKVLSPDGKGSHVDHGVEYLRDRGISDDVIICVKEHHSDSYSSIESAIVALADQISGARPGARSEDYEAYYKRMKDLEEAASSFDGVEKVYAISAGKEVRVFVKPEIVDDASTALLAREIASKIELEQTYPGVVNVTVIRETRKTEIAR